VENDDPVKSDIEGKKKEEAVQRIKNRMLRIREEGVAGELERVPERKIPSLDALDPEESRRNEIGSQVSFGEKVSAVKQIVKEEERRKEKEQNSR